MINIISCSQLKILFNDLGNMKLKTNGLNGRQRARNVLNSSYRVSNYNMIVLPRGAIKINGIYISATGLLDLSIRRLGRTLGATHGIVNSSVYHLTNETRRRDVRRVLVKGLFTQLGINV